VEHELTGRVVHVWPVSTLAPDAVVERFQPLLTQDETDRAGRFRFERLQRSFILARGALRVLLGRYLNIAPGDIEFSYGFRGKPALATPGLPQFNALQFNASHSGDLALFAFTMDCEVGVDVEAIRPMPDIEDVAKRFFCAEETAELMSLPDGQREHGFFLCWTRKEAYIKATGDGLSTPLDAFRVSLRPSEAAGLVHLERDPIAAQAWTLHDLAPAPGYAAALAYRDSPRPLETFPFLNPKQLLDIA
jgi:4'-phosphopantetheinyl transferase